MNPYVWRRYTRTSRERKDVEVSFIFSNSFQKEEKKSASIDKKYNMFFMSFPEYNWTFQHNDLQRNSRKKKMIFFASNIILKVVQFKDI